MNNEIERKTQNNKFMTNLNEYGVAAFDARQYNTVDELTGALLSITFVGEKSLLSQAKMLEKLRTIFNDAKKTNTQRNKNRSKGEPKHIVSIYGCETYVEYCEQYLHIARSTANTVANVAKLISDDGIHSIFAKTGAQDFGFKALMIMVPLTKLKSSDETTDLLTELVSRETIKPDMSTAEIEKIVKQYTQPKVDAEKVDNEENNETMDEAHNSSETINDHIDISLDKPTALTLRNIIRVHGIKTLSSLLEILENKLKELKWLE